MSTHTKSIIIIVIVLLLGWGASVMVSRNSALEEDRSVFYPAQNRDHIAVGAAHGEYSSNPPSSGWHYERTAKKKFYEEPVPDEYIIHNLEHGDVWIAYHPRISAEAKEALKEFAFAKMVITPRESNDTDLALVAWERVDAFDLEDKALPETRIRDFVKRYRNQGPEKIPAGALENTFN